MSITTYADLADSDVNPREWMAVNLLPHEIERADAIDLALHYARTGRRADALAEIRRVIQSHFEDRPDDGGDLRHDPVRWWKEIARRQAAHARWLSELREMLAVRRGISGGVS